MKRIELTGTQGLEYFANQFFNLPVKEQDVWTKSKLGVSARTFRRWCEKHQIKVNVVKTITL